MESGEAADDSRIKTTKKEVQVLIDQLLEGFEESFDANFPHELEVEAFRAPSTNPQEYSSVQGGFHSMEIEPPLTGLKPSQSYAEDGNYIRTSDGRYYCVLPTVIQPEEEQIIVMEEEELQPQIGIILPFDEVPAEDLEVELELELNGWTRTRLRILHHQLLCHIQLAGHLFTQSYSHPAVWKYAVDFMAFLDGLVTARQNESQQVLHHLCWNLDDMMRICANWKADLDADTEENIEYVKDLLPRGTRSAQAVRFFPNRLAELWVTERAFIFDRFLPNRVVNFNTLDGVTGVRFTDGEYVLLAMCCEMALGRKVSTAYKRNVSEYYESRYNQAKRVDRLMVVFDNRSDRNDVLVNFVKHNKLPVIRHELMTLGGYDEVVPHADKPRKSLPKKWDWYVFGNRRVSTELLSSMYMTY